MLQGCYNGAFVLLTGVTGFLGKVILEKILWSLPDVEKIFILVRPKKGTDTSERLRKEVIESPCFDRLRARHTDFSEFITKKLEAISGDMQKEKLGLSPEKYIQLATQVNIVIHSAASVDFALRLDQAVQINVIGSLRLLEFAKDCTHIRAYVHVSTAYVNSNRSGLIEEKIYPMAEDPAALIHRILSMSQAEVVSQTPKLIGKYPNTYTYAKNLCENMIKATKGNLPVSIVRPTIIGGSWRDPCAGWVDTLSACGSIYLLTGLGLLKVAIGRATCIADIIPVDFVANVCICAAARFAGNPDLQIIHAGSSALNPTTWLTVKNTMLVYWRKSPSEKAISSPSLTLISNMTLYRTTRFLQRELPYYLFRGYAIVSQNNETMKNAQRYKQMLDREVSVAKALAFFVVNEWVFGSQKVGEIISALSKSERSAFLMDVSLISWKTYFTNYTYGIHKWILKEKVERPIDPENLDLNLDSLKLRYFEDVMWTLNQPLPIATRPMTELRSLILNSDRVQTTIKSLSNGKLNEVPRLRKQADEMVREMYSDFRPKMVRLFAWGLRKVWRRIYEKVVIDPQAMHRLRELFESKTGPVVLLPSHRSYMDLIIVSYLLFAYGIKVPFIAARDDILQMPMVSHILRMVGAFFIRRNSEDVLYKAVLTEYIQRLLKDDQILQFFIEGQRSRTGKALSPDMSLLSICTDSLFTQAIPQLHLVPITINYDRVIEGETFPFMLLGEEKVKETFGRLIKATKILGMNFGKIHVNMGDPIDVSKFISHHTDLKPFANVLDRGKITEKLGFEVIYRLQENLVIMPTSIVAAVLLMNRRAVGEEELVRQANWLREEVRLHGYKLGDGNSLSFTTVRNAVMHVGDTLTHKKEVFDQTLIVKPDYRSVLLLSYYRNALAHIFYQEAFCICALNAFGERLAFTEGVLRFRIIEEVLFLESLFRREYLSRKAIEGQAEAEEVIERLQTRGVLETVGANVRVSKGKTLHVAFLCSMIWPLVDTIWTSMLFSSGLKDKPQIPYEKVLSSIQLFAESLYEERVIAFYESCSIESIKHSLSTLSVILTQSLGIIHKSGPEGAKSIILAATDEGILQEMLDHIAMFKKTAYTKSLVSAEEVRKGLLSDFSPKL